MKENIYNIFILINNNLIESLGAVEHSMNGSDEQKLNFLKDNVSSDLKNIKYFPVPRKFIIRKTLFIIWLI